MTKDFAILQVQVRTARSAIDRRQGERDTLQRRRNELATVLEEGMTRTVTITDAGILLREAANLTREQIRERIENLTTAAVQSVFGPGYAVKLLAEIKAERPTIALRVITPYGEGESLETGIDAHGGGLLDIVSLALRAAMLQATGKPGPMILDEPARHVSEDNIPAAGALLRELSTRFHRQMLYVTHNTHLAALADRQHIVSLVDGASTVTASA